MTAFIFAAVGFCCFIGAVIFYIRADDRAWKRDINAFTQAAQTIKDQGSAIETHKKEIEELKAERAQIREDVTVLDGEVGKLHDSNASLISMTREAQLRVEAVERYKNALPAKIEIQIVDKTAKTVSNLNQKRGNNEQTATPKQTPTPSGKTVSTTKQRSALGRSYREVEKRNSKRNSTSLIGN